MTVDVNVLYTDEDFLDDIDEIIEDTMVEMFFLQPADAAALAKAKEDASTHNAIFYVVPLTLRDDADANCVGYRIDDIALFETLPTLDKPVFIDEAMLDDNVIALLSNRAERGIVLNATKPHDELENFYISVGPGTVDAFDAELLSKLEMDKIVLQSSYPDHNFDTIFGAVKKVSDALFRPEQSIIARATKHTLALTGFKK